jgi:hypothetical protein
MATQEEVAQSRITTALSALETAYQDLLQSGKLIATQLGRGTAKCTEIKEYNLLMMSTYNQQLAWLQAMQDAGIAGVPQTPPFPTLFAVMGIPGEEALRIDCTLLPNLVGPEHIKIVTSGSEVFGGPMSEWQSFSYGELGDLGLVTALIVAGVIVATAIAGTVVLLDRQATQRQLSADKARMLERRASTLKEHSIARATCNDRCLAKIVDPGSQASIQKCADVCDKIHPKIPDSFFSDGTPKDEGGILRTIGIIAVLAAVSIGGAAMYKRYKRRKAGGDGGSGSHALVPYEAEDAELVET